MDELPVAEAWLTLKGPGIIPTTLGIQPEQIARTGSGPITLVLERASTLRFVASGKDPKGCQAGLVSAEGYQVSLWVQTRDERMLTLSWDLEQGASPIYKLREGDYTLYIWHADGSTTKTEVHLPASQLTELSVP